MHEDDDGIGKNDDDDNDNKIDDDNDFNDRYNDVDEI